MAIDPEALAASVRRLATLRKPGTGVVEALRHVTEACVGLFGVTGSGIMLVDEQNTLATAVAAHNTGELALQLQYALDYRVIIERGVGYLMARDQVDSMIAFDRLRRAARDTQSKIGDAAQRLVSTGRLPTETSRSASPDIASPVTQYWAISALSKPIVMHIQGKVAIPDAPLRNDSLGVCRIVAGRQRRNVGSQSDPSLLGVR
jgi:hypothetical protein